jgi:VWFA-related protein
MKISSWNVIGLFALTIFAAFCAQAQRGGPIFVGANAERVTFSEDQAFQTFHSETFIDKKIQLGEEFEKSYPKSIYLESVDNDLLFLYYNRGIWSKFYSAADRCISENPNNMAVLRLLGWVIGHDYDPLDPSASAKLTKAEKYEKQVLAMVAAMKKSKQLTDEEFAEEKASNEWQAHSALGMIDYRRKDYENSAREFQTAVSQESPGPNAGDLFVLAIDLQTLSRTNEAVDTFDKCAQISGDWQDRCKYGAAHPAEELAYTLFREAPGNKDKLAAGEAFDAAYPASEYQETVDSVLVVLYSEFQQWDKFYSAAEKVLAKDPDNVPVLAYVGWMIPRVYDSDRPGAAAQLEVSEKYDKRALELIPTMQPSLVLTGDEFDQAKSDAAWEAHSGLGLAYFRRKDFQASANELESATKQLAALDQLDLYVFGVDLRRLNRNAEAVDAFTKCSRLQGELSAQCGRDANAARTAAALPAAPEVPAATPLPVPTAAAPSSDLNLAGAASSAPAAELSASENRPAPPALPPVNVPPPAAADIANSTEQEARAVIKTKTVSVPVRVIVRDNDGRPIAGLKKEDFKIYQDGKQQQLLNFTAVRSDASKPATPSATSLPASSSSPSPASAIAAPPSAQPTAAAPPAARFIALFFDDVHLYFGDSAFAREAAQKYIDNLPPQSRVAIITASGNNQSDFTSDRSKLAAALKNLTPRPFAGGSMHPTDAKCPPPMTYTEAEAIDAHGSDPVTNLASLDFITCYHLTNDDAGRTIARAAAKESAAQTQIAGEEAMSADLDSMQKIVRRLAMFPGQRSIVMVTPGFMYGDHASQFAELINLALRYNVVINTLDAKAVLAGGDGGWSPDRFQAYGYGHFEESAVMQDLASGTGGLFIRFNNDLTGAMREMSEPPEAYYLLAYAPQDLAPDGKFHALKVTVAKHSADSVQARRGFYAPSHVETPQQAAAREIDDAVFSEDEQHELPLKIGTALSPSEPGNARVSVFADLDVSGLHFFKSNGTNSEEVTLVASLFDDDGNYVTATKKVVTMKYDDASLLKANADGAKVTFDFDLKSGHYLLRVVGRDANDEHLSALNSSVTVPK